MNTRMRKMALWAYLVMICGLLASCSNDNKPDMLADYKNQALDWQTCTQNQIFREALGGSNIEHLNKLGDRAKCAFMRAPLDYDDPSKGDVQIALLRVSAEDPQQRLGAIMFNPGGPGGDGLYLSIAFGTLWTGSDITDPIGSLYKQMSQRYDLIGFSPRGTGASTNLTCLSDALFKFEATIAVDDSQANWDNILYNSRLIAENCSKNPQMPYMNSETTVRDLDMMRHLLGDNKFNYIGYSYGTWLGTWYAGLYPERVGRMLLIGNTDISAPINDVLLPQGMGMQRVMDQVLGPYATRHPNRFSLGSTVEDVKQAYLSLRAMIPRYLLAATAESQSNTISKSSKADDTLLYLRAAQKMQDFIRGNPNADETAVKAWINETQFVSDQELNKQARTKAIELNSLYFSKMRHETKKAALKGQDALSWAVMCNDARSSFGVDDWIRQNRDSAVLYPMFGGFWARNACLYWGAPTAERPPIEAVISAGNIMMLQSELDPWTPLEGAMKTFASLPNTSMILVQNEYSHTLLLPYGSECIDRPVAEYFLYGKKPERLTTCSGNPLAADAAGIP
jgi:pimeloyl-ACP methyl ester carboxylesterase